MSAVPSIITSQVSKDVETFTYEKDFPSYQFPIWKKLNELHRSLEPLYYADGYYNHPLEPEQLEKFSGAVQEFLLSDAAVKLRIS